MDDNRSPVPLLGKWWWRHVRRVRGIAVAVGLLLLLSTGLTATAVARRSDILSHLVSRDAPPPGSLPTLSSPVAVAYGPTPAGRRWETLEQLAQAGGFTPLVPAYVPSGCSERERFSLPQFHAVYLTYSCVDISQQPGKPAQPAVGAGSTEEVLVGNQPAIYSKGAWVNYPPYPGNQFRGGTVWREDVAQELVFERDGLVIHLHAGPTSVLSKEELLRIAASLQPAK